MGFEEVGVPGEEFGPGRFGLAPEFRPQRGTASSPSHFAVPSSNGMYLSFVQTFSNTSCVRAKYALRKWGFAKSGRDKRPLDRHSSPGPTAAVLSLAASVRRHGLDPWGYLKHILTELPARSVRADLTDLLLDPWGPCPGVPAAVVV